MDKNLIVNIVLLSIFFSGLVFIWKLGYKKQANKALLIFVIQAEKAWGSKTGKIKFAEVYSRLPIGVKLLFSQDEISEMIESAVELMKSYIEENIKNETTISK